MIIEAIMNVIAFVILGVIKLFPTIPQIDTSFLDGIIRVFSLIDTFVSLRVLSGCIVVFLVVMNLRTIWSVIMWVVRKIPSIN